MCMFFCLLSTTFVSPAMQSNSYELSAKNKTNDWEKKQTNKYTQRKKQGSKQHSQNTEKICYRHRVFFLFVFFAFKCVAFQYMFYMQNNNVLIVCFSMRYPELSWSGQRLTSSHQIASECPFQARNS